jgi:hypothetical protein
MRPATCGLSLGAVQWLTLSRCMRLQHYIWLCLLSRWNLLLSSAVTFTGMTVTLTYDKSGTFQAELPPCRRQTSHATHL